MAAGLGGGEDALDHIDGNGEADAHAAAGARIDRRIDAHEPAPGVDQRAAGIAGVDGGVGLNEEPVVVDADVGARQRRDDALRHALADAEGIAERDDEIADLYRVGIAERDGRKRGVALDLEHRQIGAGIVEHDGRRIFALVGERDLHVGHAGDDVVVGDDEAAGIDDDAGAQRLGDALTLPVVGLAEEMAEERIVEHRVARHGLDARGVDVDDRGPDLRHDRREGQMHLGGARRHDAIFGPRPDGGEQHNGQAQAQQASLRGFASYRPPKAARQRAPRRFNVGGLLRLAADAPM